MLKKLVAFSIFFTLVTQSIISEVKANTNYDYLIHINESFDKHPIHLTGFYRQGYWIKPGFTFKKSSLNRTPQQCFMRKRLITENLVLIFRSSYFL
jgi:hypothetical protein